jgi:hypothetical protein
VNVETSGPAIVKPAALALISQFSGSASKPDTGLVFLEVRDCNDAAERAICDRGGVSGSPARLLRPRTARAFGFQPSKGPLVIGGVAAAVLFLGGTWVFGSDEEPPPAAAAAASARATIPSPAALPNPPNPAPVPQSGQAPVAPETVSLVINASPPEAVLYMDGLPLRGNPYTARVRADGELHFDSGGRSGTAEPRACDHAGPRAGRDVNLSSSRAQPARASVRPSRRPGAQTGGGEV